MNIRLLPVAIFVAVLMLGVKASDIWLGIEMLAISPSHAQQAAEQKPGATAAKPPAKAGAEKAKSGPQESGAKAADKQQTKSGDGKADGAAEGNSAATDKKDGFPEDPILFTQAEIDLLQRLADRRIELEIWRRDIEMRERLLKVGVWIEVTVRRIVLHLPASYPFKHDWGRIAVALGARVG